MKRALFVVLTVGFCLTVRAGTDESTDSGVIKLPETVVTENTDTLVLKAVTPSYPCEMARECMTGYARADVSVNKAGSVIGVRIAETNEQAFGEAAEEALWNWKFSRSNRDHRRLTIPIRFDLPGMPHRARPVDRPEVIVTATFESQVVRSIAPEYPSSLCRNCKTGKVVLEATVDEDGRVIGVSVLETDHRKFADAAREALWQWEFIDSARPLPDGKRQVKVPIRFMIAGY